MVGKIEGIEQLVEKIAQNYSEIVSERNRLRDELAQKNEQTETLKREHAREIEQLKGDMDMRERDNSQSDARMEALHSRLETLLENKVSEVLTGGV